MLLGGLCLSFPDNSKLFCLAKEGEPNFIGVYIINYTGSCGGSWFPLSQSTFHTPMFPNHYPGNLDCEWRILAEEGQQVQITFHSVATERNFDVVQVIDGPCWDSSNVMATISGKQAKKTVRRVRNSTM